MIPDLAPRTLGRKTRTYLQVAFYQVTRWFRERDLAHDSPAWLAEMASVLARFLSPDAEPLGSVGERKALATLADIARVYVDQILTDPRAPRARRLRRVRAELVAFKEEILAIPITPATPEIPQPLSPRVLAAGDAT